MRFYPVVAVVLFCSVFASGAGAAEMFEVMLKTGQTAILEVVESSPDSITVKFQKDDVKGLTKLVASTLDPYCFYEIRRETMEITAENHIKLAIYCVSEGLFSRAVYQVELAESIDPEIIGRIQAMPDAMDEIADQMLFAAKRAYDAGKKQLAYDIGSRIVTDFPETKAAQMVRKVIDLVEAEIDEEDRAANALREKKIAEERDAEAKKVTERRERSLAPLRGIGKTARKHNYQGLQESNPSNSRKYFETAAMEYQKLLDRIGIELKAAVADPQLTETLREMESDARRDGVKAWLNTGNVLLTREDFIGAQECGRKALRMDPDNADAHAFLIRVATARVMGQDIDGWRDRHGYGGPGRAAAGEGR